MGFRVSQANAKIPTGKLFGLKKHDLTNILALTLRYYGGVKLGAGGLTTIGAGESATQVKNNVAANTETLYLASDNGVNNQSPDKPLNGPSINCIWMISLAVSVLRVLKL